MYIEHLGQCLAHSKLSKQFSAVIIIEEKGMTEDDMAGWHHQLNGHEFEQGQEVGDGQKSLAC